MEIQFLVLFLIPLALQASTSYMRPHVSGTKRVGFSKQDARGNLVVASLLVNFPFSAFCQRFLLWMSVGLITNHTKVDCCLSYDSFLVLCSRRKCGPSSLRIPSQRDLQRTPAIWHASQSQSQRASYLWATTSPTAQKRRGCDSRGWSLSIPFLRLWHSGA
jgi:hypothetical protein